MWDALARATGDVEDLNPDSNEVWQFMGTYNGLHQFRHRHRPRTARAIPGWGTAWDRVYLDLSVDTLAVVRVQSRIYPPAEPEAPIRCTTDRTGSDYGGAFDGFTVSSDADPGL